MFDPSGVTGQGSATWSPLRAASTTSGAVRAARALAEASPRPTQQVEQTDFWSQMAESLLASLLCLAANAEDRTFSDVVRWVLSTDMPSENFVGEVAPLLLDAATAGGIAARCAFVLASGAARGVAQRLRP